MGTNILLKLDRRASNEIFSQYIEPHSSSEIAPNRHKLILQFLGYISPDNTSINVLHQCVLKIKSSQERNNILEEMKKAFGKIGQISIIEGYINEIIMSIS